MQSLHQTFILLDSIKRHREVDVLCPRCSQITVRLMTLNNLAAVVTKSVVDHEWNESRLRYNKAQSAFYKRLCATFSTVLVQSIQ